MRYFAIKDGGRYVYDEDAPALWKSRRGAQNHIDTINSGQVRFRRQRDEWKPSIVPMELKEIK